uniref:Uncharacterized protein n=1 Tax=viral metagenome TaxID=1070528 RepID=A0A6C0HAI2_9ZZZZ
MPLVNFNQKSIVDGYTKDVNSFINNNKMQNIQPMPLIENVNTIDEMANTMNAIITKINGILLNNGVSGHALDWVNFEYSHDIYDIVLTERPILWLLRHQLCYQILLFTFIILKNESLFTSIFSKEIIKDGYKITMSAFKRGSEFEIEKFKLGIWGSINVTSDIDIGFQYSEPKNRTEGIISYVLKAFEDLFIYFTGKSTLKFDIEPYGDMMYFDIDQPNGKTLSSFYCDTTDFDNNDLIEMMPEIGASIIRNYIQSRIDLSIIKEDIRRFKINEPINEGNKKQAMQIINNFNFVNENNNAIPEFSNLSSIIGIDIFKQNSSNSVFQMKNSNYPWIEESKKIAADYLLNIYDFTRIKYYNIVEKAENILSKNIIIFNGSTLNANKDTKKIRKELMKAIALALNYRAESHVSPSTIMHVVRVIQGKERLEGQICDAMSYPKPKAQCSLGRIGYIISMIENLGFLMRFRLTYCYSRDKKDKCDSKINKYLPRFISGLLGLNSIQIEKYNNIYGKHPFNIDIINKLNESQIKDYTEMYKNDINQATTTVQQTIPIKSNVGGTNSTHKRMNVMKIKRKNNKTIRKHL